MTATYKLTPSSSSIAEGATDYITLSTTGLNAGTEISYAISGIPARDLLTDSLTGSAIINSAGQALIALSPINNIPIISNPISVSLTNSSSVPTINATINSSPTGFTFNGMSMSTYNQNAYLSSSFSNLISNAVSSGINYVELSNEPLINLTTGKITDWINPDGSNYTASFDSIGPAIFQAEQAGLNVFLKPQIGTYDSFASYTGNLWDSRLVITDPNAFFSSYQNYIVQWAKLAQQYNVPLFSIGNEMAAATISQYTNYWDQIIAAVRQVYTGKITYSALSGVPGQIGSEVSQIQFWNLLDYVGVDVYPNFPTGNSTPSVSDLNLFWQSQGWNNYLSNIANKTGKQIIFTESGVTSSVGGAVNSANPITQQPDFATQQNWYQSFFDTWTGPNKPSWLTGVFFWDNNPQDTGVSYSAGFDVNGKPSGEVLAANFGGYNFLNVTQNLFTGTLSNDKVCLYGALGPSVILNANGAFINKANTYVSTINLALSSPILNNSTPTIHFFINGIDFGTKTLSPSGGTYIDSNGVTWTPTQTFSFSLNGLVNISEIKIQIDSPQVSSNGENSSVYVPSADINGVQLSSFSYNSISSTIKSFTVPIGKGSTYVGGYATIDPSPFNSSLTNSPGSISNPILVNGGGGTDTVYALGSVTNYSLTKSAGTWNLNESSGLNQNAVLTAIAQVDFQDGTQIPLMSNLSGYQKSLVSFNGPFSEYGLTISGNSITIDDSKNIDLANTSIGVYRFHFSDTNIAFDFASGQSSYNTVMTIGTAFGANLVAQYFPVGVSVFDTGLSISQVANIIEQNNLIEIQLGISNANTLQNDTSWFNLIYQNVMGIAPTASISSSYVSQLLSGQLTRASLLGAAIGVAEAGTGTLATQLNLIGLAHTGLHYTPLSN